MAAAAFLVSTILFSCLAASCYGSISFLSLPKSLVVTASPSAGQVLKSGKDQIKVTWSYNNTFPTGTADSTYKTIKVKLCYAPISQVDRGWRKTVDNLAKDKTCQFKIVTKPYSTTNNTITWTIARNTPSATYFVRAYAVNSADQEVGFGQTTDDQKKTNLFEVDAITGRHASLDIAAICFSAFSVVSLFGFFFLEKRNAKASQQK